MDGDRISSMWEIIKIAVVIHGTVSLKLTKHITIFPKFLFS